MKLNSRDKSFTYCAEIHCGLILFIKIVFIKRVYERAAQEWFIMKKTSIFGILSFTVITALASRKALMFPEAGTWITMENFTTMISKSFVFSKCCNIYLSGWYACDWVTDSARSQVPIRRSISMRSQRKILESYPRSELRSALSFQTRFTTWICYCVYL